MIDTNTQSVNRQLIYFSINTKINDRLMRPSFNVLIFHFMNDHYIALQCNVLLFITFTLLGGSTTQMSNNHFSNDQEN